MIWNICIIYIFKKGVFSFCPDKGTKLKTKEEKMKTLLVLATLLLNSALYASMKDVQNLSKEEAQMDMARAQSILTLKKPDAKNNTRINLLVIDNGGSTDVSPTIALYLTFWKDGEMGDATTSFLIAPSFSLVDYTYKNGKLVLKLKQLGEKGFVTETVNVDFSAFAKHFEKEALSVEEEFGVEQVQGTIKSDYNPEF
jgi:hypothetical protein